MRIDADISIPKVDRVAVMATKPAAPREVVANQAQTRPQLRVVN
jgi:hypothetical protein